MSEKYYWDVCSDFREESAKQCALKSLSDRVIGDAVNKTRNLEEILKTIEINARLDRIEQKGMVEIIAWIAKDSVSVTIEKPITQKPAPVQTPPHEQPVASDNPVLQELTACKTYEEVRMIVTKRGLVSGSKINSYEGFINPERCIIAVFNEEGVLVAFLGTGSSFRTDLLTGKTVQNPEQFYKREGYYLWYMQQKNN